MDDSRITEAADDDDVEVARARVFWSGGSQAVRLPKAMRIETSEVLVRKEGLTLVLVPLPEPEEWEGFWDRLQPLSKPIKRYKTRAAERRKPL